MMRAGDASGGLPRQLGILLADGDAELAGSRVCFEVGAALDLNKRETRYSQ